MASSFVCLSVCLCLCLYLCTHVSMRVCLSLCVHLWNVFHICGLIYIRPLNYCHKILFIDFSRHPSTVKLGSAPPSGVYTKSQLHPRYVSAHVSNSQSKINPIMASSGFSAVEKSLTSSPKHKTSETFSMFYGIHRQKLNTPSVKWVHMPTYVCMSRII